jgi:hypothetical protein
VNEAYVQTTDYVPVGLSFTTTALEQPAPPYNVPRITPWTTTAALSLVYEAYFDIIVLCSPCESVGDVLVTPEIIRHRAALGTPSLRAVAYTVEVAGNDLIHTLRMTVLHKVTEIAVDRLPKPPFPDTIQP